MNFYPSLLVILCGAGNFVPALQSNVTEGNCQKDEFVCSDIKHCIPKKELCDHVNQCPDGSDERNCTCATYEFPCKRSTCIHKDWLCDGVKDCPSGDDEEGTTCEKPCERGFKCKKRYRCISASTVCDGKPNCADFSDEHNCFKLENDFLTATYKGVRGFHICSDLWPTTYSDEICRKYRKNTKARLMYETAGQKDTLKLLNNFRAYNHSEKPSVKFLKISSCKSNMVIKIRCALTKANNERGCGYRREGLEESGGLYLINGIKAMTGAYPWHAQIIVEGNYVCGGSIIHQDWILTAAHCFKSFVLDRSAQKPFQVKIVVGTNIKNHPWATSMKVARIVLHPSHEEGHNDIALVKLDKSLRFSSRISPICLPNNMSLSQMMSYRYCVISGFGNTNRASYQPARLMHRRMNLMNGRECEMDLEKLGVKDKKVVERYVTDKSILCAGSIPALTGNNVCGSDSGNPLVCMDSEETWFQVGLASHTIRVNKTTCTNSIHMRVTHYMDFIREKISKSFAT